MDKLADLLIMSLLSVALALLGLHAIVHGVDAGLFLLVAGCLGMLCGIMRMDDTDDDE